MHWGVMNRDWEVGLKGYQEEIIEREFEELSAYAGRGKKCWGLVFAGPYKCMRGPSSGLTVGDKHKY